MRCSRSYSVCGVQRASVIVHGAASCDTFRGDGPGQHVEHAVADKVQEASRPQYWYAVHGGKHPGVYHTFADAVQWSQSKGLIKKFPDYSAAKAFVKDGLKSRQ